MDEADLLGDRIAILCEGVLQQAAGLPPQSPSFLPDTGKHMCR